MEFGRRKISVCFLGPDFVFRDKLIFYHLIHLIEVFHVLFLF